MPLTQQEEAELIAEVEDAKARLRTSLKKSKALIAAYRARLAGADASDRSDPKNKPIFRFRR